MRFSCIKRGPSVAVCDYERSEMLSTNAYLNSEIPPVAFLSMLSGCLFRGEDILKPRAPDDNPTIKVSPIFRPLIRNSLEKKIIAVAMADYQVSPALETHVNQTSSGKLNVVDDKHHSTEGAFSPEIEPIYENDIDLERGMEKRRADIPFAERSSIESRLKIDPGEEIQQEDEEDQPGVATRYWIKYRPFGHAIIWLLLTAYFCLERK